VCGGWRWSTSADRLGLPENGYMDRRPFSLGRYLAVGARQRQAAGAQGLPDEASRPHQAAADGSFVVFVGVDGLDNSVCGSCPGCDPCVVVVEPGQGGAFGVGQGTGSALKGLSGPDVCRGDVMVEEL
jgi:hypothetical protein